jgi:hypothetical protein
MRLISAGSLVRAQSGPYFVPADVGVSSGQPFTESAGDQSSRCEKQDITILKFGERLIAQTRPLSASGGKVFFDICILGRKYNFGESEMEVGLHFYQISK